VRPRAARPLMWFRRCFAAALQSGSLGLLTTVSMTAVAGESALQLSTAEICAVVARAWTEGTESELGVIPTRSMASKHEREVKLQSREPWIKLGSALGTVNVSSAREQVAVEVYGGGSCFSVDIVLATPQANDTYAVTSDDAELSKEQAEAFGGDDWGTSARLIRVGPRLLKVRGEFTGHGLEGTPVSLYELEAQRWVPRCTFSTKPRYRTVGGHPACKALAAGQFQPVTLRWSPAGVTSAKLSRSSERANDAALIVRSYEHSGGCGGTRTWAYYQDEFESKTRDEVLNMARPGAKRAKTLALQHPSSSSTRLPDRLALEQLFEQFHGNIGRDGLRWPEASSWHMAFISIDGKTAILTDSADHPARANARYPTQLVLNGPHGPEVVCTAMHWPRVSVNYVAH
jgi:hypothetical protein